MPVRPQPLFDTYRTFVELDFNVLTHESGVVIGYLKGFDDALLPFEGYTAVRAFLRSYSANQATFNSYRTHVERLLLWSLIVHRRPILSLRRQDAEAYMEFCLNPPPTWIGPVIRARFSPSNGDAPIAANPKWCPFTLATGKRERKLTVETGQDFTKRRYQMSQGAVAQVFAVCSSFYEFAIDEGLTDSNPFRAIKQKSHYKQRHTSEAATKALTSLQWNYVLETAETMASDHPARHERSLFITATLFSMYLRVSDLVGRENWKPCMGSFRRDSAENWWFHVVGKGNKAAKISVRDEYIERYLTRYRKFLSLPALPSPNESTPLLTTTGGRAGLSDRQVRSIMQSVFDQALQRMLEERRSDAEVDSLRSASIHWLRHTSATFDAPFRDAKDLQTDMRHSSLGTTQDIYYNSHDEKRASSIKRLGMKDRG